MIKNIKYMDLPGEVNYEFSPTVIKNSDYFESDFFDRLEELHSSLFDAAYFFKDRLLIPNDGVKYINRKEQPFLCRYDVILDKEGQPWVIECNAETPAGIPETNLAFGGKWHEYLTFNEDLTGKTVHVLYASYSGDEEDKANAEEIAVIIRNKFKCTVHVVDVRDLDVQDDWGLTQVTYKGSPVVNIFSFYPYEWMLEDGEAGRLLMRGYRDNTLHFINPPSSLLLQSKVSMVFAELCGQKQLIPKTSTEYFEGSIKKPIWYREGVGIDTEEDVLSIYQKRIEQMTVPIKILGKDLVEKELDMYITFGFYISGGKYVGSYHRACETPITNFQAFYVPSV